MGKDGSEKDLKQCTNDLLNIVRILKSHGARFIHFLSTKKSSVREGLYTIRNHFCASVRRTRTRGTNVTSVFFSFFLRKARYTCTRSILLWCVKLK